MYRPCPNVVATTLDDSDSVLLHLNTRRYYTLNETGTRIWQLVNDELPVRDIVSSLLDEYEIDQEDLRRHVESLLSELQEEGLVEEVSNAPSG